MPPAMPTFEDLPEEQRRQAVVRARSEGDDDQAGLTKAKAGYDFIRELATEAGVKRQKR